MGRRIRLEPHLTADELERSYRAAREPHERSWHQILWLLAKGQLAREIAESTGYSRYWIGQVARRYNLQGPEGMVNRQYTHSHRTPLTLSAEQLAELAEAVRGPMPEGDHWIGRTVADWMRAKLGRPVSVQLGWAYLVRLEGKRRTGLGMALLRHAFGEFYRRGERRVGLGVDAQSLTGATRLYERAGMRVAQHFAVYRKELRPGPDLSTHSTA